MGIAMDSFRDRMSEPVRKIIEENPGLTLSEIAAKIDRSTWSTIKLTDRQFINGLRYNHIYHLKQTGKIEDRRSSKGARYYIKEPDVS